MNVDRQIDVGLAMLLGYHEVPVPKDARGENAGHCLVPPGPAPWERGPNWTGYELSPRGAIAYEAFVPRWSSDWEASRELELALRVRGIGGIYVGALVRIVAPEALGTVDYGIAFALLQATPMQRATAALIALDKVEIPAPPRRPYSVEDADPSRDVLGQAADGEIPLRGRGAP